MKQIMLQLVEFAEYVLDLKLGRLHQRLLNLLQLVELRSYIRYSSPKHLGVG